MGKYAIYIRVSTARQGSSGLGLDAQKDICTSYINSVSGEILEVFKDVESGKKRTRTGLLSALDFCKTNECTLVIAKLDRLARDVEFTFRVINTGVNIYFCDMPMVNTMILGVFASVAQYERELNSKRTKEALLEIKKRIKLGGGRAVSKSGNIITQLGSKKGCDCSPAWTAAAIAHQKAKEDDVEWQKAKALAEKLKSSSCDVEYIMNTLNEVGIKTRRGNKYNLTAVYRLLKA